MSVTTAGYSTRPAMTSFSASFIRAMFGEGSAAAGGDRCKVVNFPLVTRGS